MFRATIVLIYITTMVAIMTLTIPPGTWTKYTQTWPVESQMVRDIEPFQGAIYISTGAPIENGGQIYKRENGTSIFTKAAHFGAHRVMSLQPLSNRLFTGTGTPHSSEGGPFGHAKWGYYTGAHVDNQPWPWTEIVHVTDADLIYSQASDGVSKVFAGTYSEDKAGLAKILQWDTSTQTLTTIGGPGTSGWPAHGYAGIYELHWFEPDDELYATTFSRTTGHGHLLRRRNGVWQNLGGVQDSHYGLAMATWDGKLVVAFSASGITGNPIRYLDSNDDLQPLGTAPASWATDGGHIPNSLDTMPDATLGDVLYLGRGGDPKTTGSWTYDATNGWQQVGGKGRGWWAPLNISSGTEWPYRVKVIGDDVWHGFAGTGETADLWSLTP